MNDAVDVMCAIVLGLAVLVVVAWFVCGVWMDDKRMVDKKYKDFF